MPTTVLEESITATQNLIQVNSAQGFPSSGQFSFTIEIEKLFLLEGAGTTTWTVLRGIEGTTPATHAARSAVTLEVVQRSNFSSRESYGPAPDDGAYILVEDHDELDSARVLIGQPGFSDLEDNGEGDTLRIIADPNGIDRGKLKNAAGPAVIGRANAGPGAVGDIAPGGNHQFLRQVEDELGFGEIAVNDLPNAIPRTKLANANGPSVIGRTGTGSGGVTDIAAENNGEFLRRDGDSLGFGEIAVNDLPNAIPRNKLANANGPSVIGRTGTGSGGVTDIAAENNGEFLRRDGDSLGFGEIAVNDLPNAIPRTKLANANGPSVIGRTGTGSGGVTDIAAENNGEFLRRDGDSLGFGEIAVNDLPNAIPRTKLANANGPSVIGRTGTGSGGVTDIAAENNGEFLRRDGDSLGFGEIAVNDLPNAIPRTKLANANGPSVIGRTGTGSGGVTDIAAENNGEFLRRDGDSLGFGEIAVNDLPNAIPRTKLANANGPSVIGRTGTGSGGVTDIAAENNGEFLRRDGDSLGFGEIAVNDLPNAIPRTKLANANGPSVIGRTGTGSGGVTDIAAENNGEFLRRDGDSLGFGEIAVNDLPNAIPRTKLANANGPSVIGRTGTGSGGVTDIAAENNGEFLRRDGDSLGFGEIAVNDLPNAIPRTKLANATGSSVIGRGNGIGAVHDIAPTDNHQFLRQADGTLTFGTITEDDLPVAFREMLSAHAAFGSFRQQGFDTRRMRPGDMFVYDGATLNRMPAGKPGQFLQSTENGVRWVDLQK